MVRNIFARTPALILLCLGIPCFVFPESTKSGSQPSSVAQASYSVDDLTNLFAAARAAYNSYKPETALAYYETAKQMSASLTCVEMEMREFKLKYRAYEHWCKNRATALDLLDFISVYNTLNSNREYEQILSIISEAPTNLPATTLDAMRNAAASSMQNRPGVTKIVMPTESGVLQTNIVRCFARLPFQTNMLASSDNKFLVKWIELQGTQSNRLVLVDNVTQRHHAIMDCLWDVTVIWSPAGKYLAVEENLADNDASVVRLVDVAKPDDVFCVNRCLPESIRQETKDAPVRLTLVKWISDECLNLFCEPSKQNGEYKCWLLRLMKINGEWVLDVMD